MASILPIKTLLNLLLFVITSEASSTMQELAEHSLIGNYLYGNVQSLTSERALESTGIVEFASVPI